MASILIVDDDESMRELLRLRLSNAGYAVTTAQDAVVGLQCLMRRAPRLMIVDVDMPYTDGLEFVSSVTADSAFAQLPVVFLTARGDVEDAARKAGARACLRKPLDTAELLATVGRLLPGSEAVGY